MHLEGSIMEEVNAEDTLLRCLYVLPMSPVISIICKTTNVVLKKSTVIQNFSYNVRISPINLTPRVNIKMNNIIVANGCRLMFSLVEGS